MSLFSGSLLHQHAILVSMYPRLALSLAAVVLTCSAQVTFTRDVAPILYAHCASCHHANDIAPMPLIRYQEVKPWAAAIREAVLARKMPPWKADPHIGKWANDPSLADSDIATIQAWVAGGKLEGNPADLPPVPVWTDGWRIGKPDAIVTIPEHKIESSGPDEYTYVTVPTNFTEDRWVTSAELRPGNRKIVHHAHVFVFDPDKPAAVKDPAKEYGKWLRITEGTLTFIRQEAPVIDNGCARDDNGLFPGDQQKDLGNLLGSYLPGRAPDTFPEGTARLIPAGSRLSFQIHYSHTSGKTEYDATSVGLIFAKEPPAQIARRIDLPNHMFLIPAGDSDHEVTECHTFTKDLYITSLTPHMHLRGKSMQIEVTYPDGRKETLLSVPKYDFNWQITYRAAQPLFVPAGTRIAIIAHFDNSRNNPMNPDPGKAIRWGGASEMEMMDGWIEYVDAPARQASSR